MVKKNDSAKKSGPMTKFYICAFIATVFMASSFGCSGFGLIGASDGASSNLRKAEELSREGKFDEAISSYRAHMQQRLEETKRPKWENPYFYLVLIGDLELGRGKVKEALISYQEANKEKVDPLLIADRMRSVARWYEDQGDMDAAMKILKENRYRDPLIFDSILDRLARDLVKKEDAK